VQVATCNDTPELYLKAAVSLTSKHHPEKLPQHTQSHIALSTLNLHHGNIFDQY
jgi:hypothetical protein